jgi:hypothetical protein
MDVHISILLESKYLLRDITLYIPLDDSLDILNIAVSEGSCNTDGAKKNSPCLLPCHQEPGRDL